TLARGLAHQPQSVPLLEAQGRLWLHLNQPQPALEALTRAAQLAPRDRGIQRLIALGRAMQGDLPQAKYLLSQALALQPQDAEMYFQLARLQEIGGDIAGAIATYTQAAQLQPARAYMHLGQLYMQQQKWDQAIAAYREVVHREPELALAHHQLGLALYQQKRYAEAESALQTAHRLYRQQNHPAGVSQVEALLEQIRQPAKSKMKPNKTAEPPPPLPYDGY
ncbi:MAG: tetratricopeptide repeat protein, partial [Gloeomargarita sp. GMQP_bins_69]